MVSVDRNTLISQIVASNPSISKDYLKNLTDAQLKSNYNQLLFSYNPFNTDLVDVNQEHDKKEKPINIRPDLGMSDNQAESTTIEVIHQNVSEAEEIYSKANFGNASKLYDSIKSEDNKLSSTNVRKVLNYQNQGMKFLIDSQYGNLSRKEYYIQSRQHLKDMILTRLFVLKTPTGESMFDSKRGKYSKDKFAQMIDEYLDEIFANKDLKELKEFQKKVLSENNFETKFLDNVTDYATKPKTKAKTGTANGTEFGYKGINDKDKGIPNNWRDDEAIPFEEVYLYERGTEYSKDNVERFTIAQANMNFVSSAYNKFQQFNQFATKASDNTLSSKQKEQMILEGFSNYYYLSENNGKNEINQLLEKTKLPMYIDETGFVFPANMIEEDKQKLLNLFLMHSKQNEQQKLDKILKDKSIDEYAQEYQTSANALLGEDDAVMMANAMKEDNLEGFKKYTSMAQIGGMGLTIVGGVLTLTPLSPLGAGMVTIGNTLAISGMGADIVNDYTNEFTKENADAESLENTNKQTLTTIGGFVIGAKAGKLADKVFQKALGEKLISTFGKDYTNGNSVQALKNLVSNPENFTRLAKAVGGKVGTDFGISYMGDLAMMGVLNTNDDWESLLKSNLMGVLVSTGSDLKGLSKTRSKVKVDTPTKPNPEVKPDGSTVEAKADGEGTKAVKPEPKTENIKTETTDKTDTSNMAEGEIKTYTQEEVDKLITQDPEHIKVMTNGKILRITDNFEFVHIGNIAKSNGIKVLDSKAFDKKISNMQNEYNDTHRFTEDDRQKLNELYNNAKTDEEKQFLLQVIDAKLFTGDYQFNAKAISELQGNYSTEAKAIYEAMANIQSKQYSKIYYNQDFVDLMNLSKSVDKDIIIELINAKNVDNTPRFNGKNIQKWVELGQKTDKTEFLDMLHATDNNGAPKYNYAQIEEKIALKNPMAKSLLTKAQNLVKNNKKIKEIKDKLIENIMNETPETVNKQFKMINLLNDNALKIFLENYGLRNLNIDKQTVDAINSAHPKVLQVILKDGADDPSISLLLRDFEKIPTKLLDSITDENKFFNLLALVHSKSLGFIDIYNNTKPETLNRIPQNVKLELAQMGHVYTNETHISSALDFIKTPKYQELKTTLFEKFDSKFDANDFDSKLQAYLIANKTGNPDDFINYVKSQDFNNLTSIAPRIKEFEPEQLFEFFNYHKSQGTKLTPENLTYKGNLTHTLETNMTDYQQLSQILSRYPNTDRRVGHLPKEWINDVPKSEQKDFVANIYQAFSNFASIPKDERNVNDLATTLKSIFKKDVKVEQLGYGSFGSGYKISIENSKPFVLKAFNNIDDDLKYMKNIHGRSIEPQNALYSKGKGNDFAGFYFGKVNDVIDKDGFMLNEFLPDKPSKSQQKDLTISRFDSSDVDRDYGHNFQYGKILDYGAMETTDKRLMENGNVAKLTRIISSNIIASKNSNVYGFNDTRLAIVKNAIDKIGNPKDTLDALSIVEKYATKEIDKNSLNELKALKKDAAFKWLEKNKPDIENKEAYFAAYELNDKITQIENSIINAFKDTGLDKGLRFSNRAKSVQSIYDKINSNMKKGKSLEASIQKVQDGYGVRTIMDDFDYKQYPEIVEMYKKDPEQAYRMAAKKQSEHIIKNLEKLIEKQLTNGDFSMVTISNYKGKNGLPYLSTEQINELCEFAKQKGITLDVKIDETGSMENIKGSGYTALQMNLKYKDGTVIEWQTRGQDVDNFAEAEHVMYDSRQEKDITGGREQLKELYAPYEKAAQDMETEDFADYMDYLTNYYKQLRLKELGFPVIFPKLPAKFGTNPDISAEGLLKLHDEKERILKAA